MVVPKRTNQMVPPDWSEENQSDIGANSRWQCKGDTLYIQIGTGNVGDGDNTTVTNIIERWKWREERVLVQAEGGSAGSAGGGGDGWAAGAGAGCAPGKWRSEGGDEEDGPGCSSEEAGEGRPEDLPHIPYTELSNAPGGLGQGGGGENPIYYQIMD